MTMNTTTHLRMEMGRNPNKALDYTFEILTMIWLALSGHEIRSCKSETWEHDGAWAFWISWIEAFKR